MSRTSIEKEGRKKRDDAVWVLAHQERIRLVLSLGRSPIVWAGNCPYETARLY